MCGFCLIFVSGVLFLRQKLTALKKAYADIILNTAKEAAARVIVSEKKAVRLQRELLYTKEEALRMLLRLKQTYDSKVCNICLKWGCFLSLFGFWCFYLSLGFGVDEIMWICRWVLLLSLLLMWVWCDLLFGSDLLDIFLISLVSPLNLMPFTLSVSTLKS